MPVYQLLFGGRRRKMLISLVLALIAFVVSLVERKCEEELSTWLLIYSLFPIIALFLICTVLCQLAFCAEVTMKDDKETKMLVVGAGCFCLLVGLLIFHYVWLLYGMIIYFPVAATHSCRLLVVVSISIKSNDIEAGNLF